MACRISDYRHYRPPSPQILVQRQNIKFSVYKVLARFLNNHHSSLNLQKNIIFKYFICSIFHNLCVSDCDRHLWEVWRLDFFSARRQYPSTDGNFDSDLIVEGVVLELQSLSSIMYLITKSLNPLPSALNFDQSRKMQS